jgi:hypothetical protein
MINLSFTLKVGGKIIPEAQFIAEAVADNCSCVLILPFFQILRTILTPLALIF